MNQYRPKRIIWKSAGYHLVEKTENGWLAVTPDLLRAYFTRPEIHPIDESCRQEHRLFERLMDDPFSSVGPAEIEEIADSDAAANYRYILRLRDHLVQHGTIEAAYRGLFSSETIDIPPIFIDQMVHLIIAGLLEGDRDPFHAKASELFFREQKATTTGGQLMFADAEIVETISETGGLGGLGGLLVESGTPLAEVSIDVLTENNADAYWDRADMFDFALDFRFTERGPDAFARIIEKWVQHFLFIDVQVQAVQSIVDPRWSWHIGLDAEASRVLNALYDGEMLEDEATERVAGLFRMEFRDQSALIASMRGKPVYLGLCVDRSGKVRVKPQNILMNLPIGKT